MIASDFEKQDLEYVTHLQMQDIVADIAKNKDKGAVFSEIGLYHKNMRFDVLNVQTWHRYVKVYEIKVNRSDFKRDDKWWKYQKYANQLYFVKGVGKSKEILEKSDVGDAGILDVITLRTFADKFAGQYKYEEDEKWIAEHGGKYFVDGEYNAKKFWTEKYSHLYGYSFLRVDIGHVAWDVFWSTIKNAQKTEVGLEDYLFVLESILNRHYAEEE